MTPIEVITARYGYEILTGTTETDLTDKNIVAVVIRSAGATLAKLAVGTTNILTERAGLSGELNSQDIPIMAGFNNGTKTTQKFTNIQLTTDDDSVSLIYGEPNE